MKNIELAELLLTRIYDIAENEGHGSIIDLMEESQKFGIKDRGKVDNIAEYLASQGLINADYSSMGPLVNITGTGAVFVENGGNTGIITKYRHEPQSFIVNINRSINIHGDMTKSNLSTNSSNVTQIVENTSEVTALLKKISETLEMDSSQTKEIIEDALKDIESLKVQLNKNEKNKTVIESLLGMLSNISSISSFVAQLWPLIFT